MLERLPGKSLPKRVEHQLPTSEPLYKGLPYVSAINDKTILLKDGSLLGSFVVEGINADTSDEMQIVELNQAMSKFISQQRSKIGFYINRLSHRDIPKFDSVDVDPFSREVDRRWQKYLDICGLRKRTTMVSIVLAPPQQATKLFNFFADSSEQLRESMEARAEELNKVVETCIATMEGAKPKRLAVSGGLWLGLMKFLIDGNLRLIKPGAKFAPLADIISNSMITFRGDSFLCEGGAPTETKFGSVISLKDYPTDTYPGIFDRLDLPYDLAITQSFTPIDNLSAQNKIALVRRQMAAAADAAVSLMAQLEVAEDNVASGRMVFGEHHCSAVVFGDSLEELETAVALVSRSLQESGAAYVRERYASRAVYFAQHAGNFQYRTRPAMISAANFTNMACMHAQPTGYSKEKSPWGDAVTIVPTARGEAFRFNFHLPGKKDSRTVGHTLVLGQTGSGKTLGTAFLLCQAQRLKPRIILFDKDNGFEMAVRCMGGSYQNVRLGIETGLNPMQAEADERGAAWLTDWLVALAENDGSQLNSAQIDALSEAVSSNTTADPSLQNFEQLRGQLRSVDDNGDLHMRLGRWDYDGQFGWMFGGKGLDPMSFTDRITAFDLTEIFDNDMVRTAWLSYVFRRIERQVEDEYPTLIVLDEAWKLLDDSYFQSRLKDWMLTMRKKNVAVILLTQRVSHITQSAAGAGILESAVSRLIYPSMFNNEVELAPLALTSREAEFLQMSNHGNHFALYKSGDQSVVLDLALGGIGGCLDVLGGGAGEKGPPGWRENPEFYQEMIQ
ncbi:MAG: type IV secretion protein [Pseudomonadota bacterium]